MRPSLKRKQFTLFAVDIIVLYFALYAALAIRHGRFPTLESWEEHARSFTLIFASWEVIFYMLRLYSFDIPFNTVRFAGRLATAFGITGLAAVLYFYLLPSAPISPKTVLLVFIVVGYTFFLSWRVLYMGLSSLSRARIQVAFIGDTSEGWELIDSFRARPHLGFGTSFLYTEAPCENRIYGINVLNDPVALRKAFAPNVVHTVILADHVALSVETRRILFDQVERGTRFERLQNFYEMYMRRVPLGVISEAWFLENIDLRSKAWYLVAKRIIDILIALVGIALSAVLWPFIALGIKLESKGPVLFKQERLGRHEKPFVIYKFRSMRSDRNDFEPTGLVDDRITKLGNFLRKSRLDEIPQMINILKGDMSLIGPRPERPELANMLSREIPFYRQRHMLKPGVTGWDQVSGEYHSPSVEDTYKKLQYDLYYVKNVSFLLDISVFFKTIMTVLARVGR